MGPLSGFTIGVTADRRATEQIQLLRGRGATCIHGPVIETHPVEIDGSVEKATIELLDDPPDVVVIMTAIGLRAWLGVAATAMLGERVFEMLMGTSIVCRGPKATGAAVAEGLDVDWSAGGSTGREVLEHVLARGADGLRVAVQLDGSTDMWLVDALEAAGAEVVPIRIYRWTVPADTAPAESLIRSVAKGQVDAVTFTARPAVRNFASIAEGLGLWDDVLAATADNVMVMCVGPVCASAAADVGMQVAASPERYRLGSMVHDLTARFADEVTEFILLGSTVELRGRLVVIDGVASAELSDRERRLLAVLASRPGAVHSKRDLLLAVWGTGGDTHTVEVTVGRLRQRLGPVGEGLETVFRRGYRLAPV